LSSSAEKCSTTSLHHRRRGNSVPVRIAGYPLCSGLNYHRSGAPFVWWPPDTRCRESIIDLLDSRSSLG
jgi:hypothetical protein